MSDSSTVSCHYILNKFCHNQSNSGCGWHDVKESILAYNYVGPRFDYHPFPLCHLNPPPKMSPKIFHRFNETICTPFKTCCLQTELVFCCLQIRLIYLQSFFWKLFHLMFPNFPMQLWPMIKSTVEGQRKAFWIADNPIALGWAGWESWLWDMQCCQCVRVVVLGQYVSLLSRLRSWPIYFWVQVGEKKKEEAILLEAAMVLEVIYSQTQSTSIWEFTPEH